MSMSISCQALQRLLADGADTARPILLDVRSPKEAAVCSLAGSILIPLPELPTRLDELEGHRGKQVVVYCHHGVRSISGAQVLREHGFSATSLTGGIDAWAREIDPSVPRY